MCSDLVRGYFLQFKDLKGLIVQTAFLSFPILKNMHLFGSLQHSPQRRHFPLLSFDIGRKEVIVLFALAPQVFIFLPIMMFLADFDVYKKIPIG